MRSMSSANLKLEMGFSPMEIKVYGHREYPALSSKGKGKTGRERVGIPEGRPMLSRKSPPAVH
ncbi:hypothetical protein DPMN_050244 [Dreissena polymorpha]|uniref:Uncharacterized protein n=1 Tax=Dreissena polymorpha TaxID=45954 RepID=A0A9D4CFR7_DREPO|nr:hypothetical protein DPMN_050244 [Dreissena polymorpha]